MLIARRIVAIAALALAALLSGTIGTTPPALAGCGQEFKGRPAHSTVPGGPPLAIGDSVLADAVPELVSDGFEADGMVCRQMSQGITILQNRAANLPHLVLLALGTNGEVTSAQIATVLQLLGPQRILVLVTPHGSVVPSTPDVIRAAAAANPSRILLLDWDRLAAAHPSWLAPDGVHLGGAAGIAGFAQMIAGVLPYATAAAPEVEPDGLETGAPVTIEPPPAHRLRNHKSKPSQPRKALPPATRTATAPTVRPAPAVKPSQTKHASSGGAPWAVIGAAALILALAALTGVYLRRRASH